MSPDEPRGLPRPGDAPVTTRALASADLGWVAVLTLLAAALRFPFLASEPFWFDEVFSTVVSSQLMPDLWRMALADETNPPGFYLLLRLWAGLGSFEEGWLRVLPALAGTLVPAATYACVRAVGASRGAGAVAGILTAASSMLVYLSVEVRAYAPLALAATVALALSLRLARHPGRGDAAGIVVALVALDIVIVSLHYFGALAVLANVGAAMVIRPRAATRLGAAAIPALALLGGWIALVFARADASVGENAGWIDEPSFGIIRRLATAVIGSLGVPAIAWLVTALLLAAVAWAFRARSRVGLALAVPALLPLLAALAIGIVAGRSLWVPRYFVTIIPPFAMLLALALDALRPVWRRPAVTCVLGWSMLAGIYRTQEPARKPDWATVLRALSDGRPTVICVNETYVRLPLEYYALKGRLPVTVLPMSQCGPVAGTQWAVYRPQTAVSLAGLEARGARLGPRVWLGTRLPETEARRMTWPAR